MACDSARGGGVAWEGRWMGSSCVLTLPFDVWKRNKSRPPRPAGGKIPAPLSLSLFSAGIFLLSPPQHPLSPLLFFSSSFSAENSDSIVRLILSPSLGCFFLIVCVVEKDLDSGRDLRNRGERGGVEIRRIGSRFYLGAFANSGTYSLWGQDCSVSYVCSSITIVRVVRDWSRSLGELPTFPIAERCLPVGRGHRV